MYLVFTANNIYIRIVNPEMPNNNLGYIAANGQLNVRPMFFNFLPEGIIGEVENFEWIDGPGMHGGVNDYMHTNHFASLFHVLVFFKGLAIQLDEQIDFHLN